MVCRTSEIGKKGLQRHLRVSTISRPCPWSRITIERRRVFASTSSARLREKNQHPRLFPSLLNRHAIRERGTSSSRSNEAAGFFVHSRVFVSAAGWKGCCSSEGARRKKETRNDRRGMTWRKLSRRMGNWPEVCKSETRGTSGSASGAQRGRGEREKKKERGNLRAGIVLASHSGPVGPILCKSLPRNQRLSHHFVIRPFPVYVCVYVSIFGSAVATSRSNNASWPAETVPRWTGVRTWAGGNFASRFVRLASLASAIRVTPVMYYTKYRNARGRSCGILVGIMHADKHFCWVNRNSEYRGWKVSLFSLYRLENSVRDISDLNLEGDFLAKLYK